MVIHHLATRGRRMEMVHRLTAKPTIRFSSTPGGTEASGRFVSNGGRLIATQTSILRNDHNGTPPTNSLHSTYALCSYLYTKQMESWFGRQSFDRMRKFSRCGAHQLDVHYGAGDQHWHDLSSLNKQSTCLHTTDSNGFLCNYICNVTTWFRSGHVSIHIREQSAFQWAFHKHARGEMTGVSLRWPSSSTRVLGYRLPSQMASLELPIHAR